MPDNPPQNVGDVLLYYSEEVVPALSVALTIDDQFPEEVLNEVRSSFTHLSRANLITPTDSDHLKELDAAARHLKRVCLDCLKVSILALAQRCEVVIEALTEEINLPNDVYHFMTELRSKRAKVAAHEGQRPTHEAVEELKGLLVQYDNFYQNLDNQFAGQTAEMRRKARKKRSVKSGILGFALGILASIIASAFWDHYSSAESVVGTPPTGEKLVPSQQP